MHLDCTYERAAALQSVQEYGNIRPPLIVMLLQVLAGDFDLCRVLKVGRGLVSP